MVFIASWFMSRNLWTLEFLHLFEVGDELNCLCSLTRFKDRLHQ